MSTWYRAGTVQVVNGSRNVAGTGTNWSAVATAIVGFAFRGPDGHQYEVESVAGATSLSLVEPYAGPNAAGAAYAIIPTMGLAADLVGLVSQLLAKTANTVDMATPVGLAVLHAPDAAAGRGALGIGAQLPVGALLHWPAQAPPAGWLKRNGAAISRTDYPDLFALLGTTYGAGNGSTTFNLPDDRGLFDRGLDDGRGIDVGRALGPEQESAVVDHRHNTVAAGYQQGLRADIPAGSAVAIFAGTTSPFQTGLVLAPHAGGTETRPRNRAYLPIIKALP